LIKDRISYALRNLKAALPQWHNAPSWQRAFRTLQRHGFCPNAIFDIGVAHGTPALYRAFPHAKYFLVDPDPQSLPKMVRLMGILNASVHAVGLGDVEGELQFEMRPDLQGSTFLKATVGGVPGAKYITVPVQRFDRLFTVFPRQCLVKIDVQGYEYKVLCGMEGVLDRIDAVIVECSTIATLDNAPEVGAVMEFMMHHGFVLADVIGMLRRPYDDATAQLDLLFMPDKAAFRQDRRWA